VRSPRRTLAATTLALEAFVVLFGALVAKDLSSLGTAAALTGGAVIAMALLVTAGLLRFRIGYVLGWLLQLVLILTGVWVPMMYGIGLIFCVLWLLSQYWGIRIERERAIVARGLAARASSSQDGPPPPP
jgi:hypothetical protein